jgi:hypothetical protein
MPIGAMPNGDATSRPRSIVFCDPPETFSEDPRDEPPIAERRAIVGQRAAGLGGLYDVREDLTRKKITGRRLEIVEAQDALQLLHRGRCSRDLTDGRT